jgi:hypothetical protein
MASKTPVGRGEAYWQVNSVVRGEAYWQVNSVRGEAYWQVNSVVRGEAYWQVNSVVRGEAYWQVNSATSCLGGKTPRDARTARAEAHTRAELLETPAPEARVT